MRSTFARTLLTCARKDPRIILISADLGFKVFDEFRSELPKQFINAGVAEQNMVSIAAGLAMSGKKVYCYSMVPFLVMRAFEQIRVDVCNHNLGVTLVGVGGGLSYGMEGMTHHGFEDIAIMRALPGMTVVAPGDPCECAAAIEQSVNYARPLFVRLGKNNDPKVHVDGTSIEIGRGVVMTEGRDVCMVVTGSMLPSGSRLADVLAEKGLGVTLISMHTVKPLDEDILNRVVCRHRAVFTVEEHSIIGGLGSAVAEYLCEKGFAGRFKRFGLPDRYCACVGDHSHLVKETGLSVEYLAENMWDICKR